MVSLLSYSNRDSVVRPFEKALDNPPIPIFAEPRDLRALTFRADAIVDKMDYGVERWTMLSTAP